MVGSPYNPRNSQEASPTPQFKNISSSALSFLYSPTLTSTHDYWKNIPLTIRTFVSRVILLLNMLSRLVIAFLPRSKCLLISWLQSPVAVILISFVNIYFLMVAPRKYYVLHMERSIGLSKDHKIA